MHRQTGDPCFRYNPNAKHRQYEHERVSRAPYARGKRFGCRPRRGESAVGVEEIKIQNPQNRRASEYAARPAPRVNVALCLYY